jgi:SAM-dependent methyltransferase
MFELAEAYERQRGRSSKLLAPLFVDFVGAKGDVLDVGCGTGALTFALATNGVVSKIVAIDVSESFLAYARSKTDDPHISFEVGDAQNLRFPDASFDCCLALLVIAFVADAPRAVREMRRVTRQGGIVATAMWDYTGGNELNDSLWEVASSLDPEASRIRNRVSAYGRAEELSSLWSSAGLTKIEIESLVFPCGFSSFEDFWQPLTEGQGPAGAYLRSLSDGHRAALRERLREKFFGRRPEGSFTLNAKAWAVRGSVP